MLWCVYMLVIWYLLLYTAYVAASFGNVDSLASTNSKSYPTDDEGMNSHFQISESRTKKNFERIQFY